MEMSAISPYACPHRRRGKRKDGIDQRYKTLEQGIKVSGHFDLFEVTPVAGEPEARESVMDNVILA